AGLTLTVDGDVHPEIERRRHFRRGQADLAHAREQVVRAVVVVLLAAKQAVTIVVAGRHQRVVDAGRGVLLEMKDRPPAIGVEVMSLARKDCADGGPHVLHRHELAEVLRAEAPGVDHLGPMRVDDLDRLTLGEARGATFARRHRHEIAFLGHFTPSPEIVPSLVVRGARGQCGLTPPPPPRWRAPRYPVAPPAGRSPGAPARGRPTGA